MKAIRVHEFGGPEVMKLEEVADLQPGPGQVVVRVHAAGVNPVESYIRTGTYAMKPNLPYTPGNDGAGVVAAVGAGVTRVKAGDRVYTSGAAQRDLRGADAMQPKRRCIHCRRTSASSRERRWAWRTARRYRGLFQRGGAKAGETVLVHGASGGVGTAAVQLARAAGMTVIGTAGTDAGLKLVKEQGAHHVLNHSTEGYLDELMKLTGGRGVDVILEMLANKNLAKDLTVLAKKGRVVVIGSRGTIEINPRDAMAREADIRGCAAVRRHRAGGQADARRAGRRVGERDAATGDRAEDSAGRGAASACRSDEAVGGAGEDCAGGGVGERAKSNHGLHGSNQSRKAKATADCAENADQSDVFEFLAGGDSKHTIET